MGASNCPETPRQRMIGMMYLVLTALLALNVSKNILDAFITVDETMVKTTLNFESKVEQTYSQLAKANSSEPDKYGNVYKSAMEIQKSSKEIADFINKTKLDLICTIEGKTIDEVRKMTSWRDLNKKADYSGPTLFFMGTNGTGEGNGKAKELKVKIKQYKEILLKFVKPEQQKEFSTKIGLETSPGKNNDGDIEEWESHNFNHTVLVAAIPLLDKIIGEVRNAEFDMLNYLMGSVDAASFKFDNVEAKVIPESRLVFSGQEYTADIIVAAVDSRQDPEVYWRGGIEEANESMVASMTKISGENGIVKLKIPAGGTGEQKFAGLVKIMAPDGTPKYYPFKSKFVVTKPMANVSADSLRILYEGIDNLVTVSAPVAPEKLRPNFPGCVAKNQGSGRYLIQPPKGGKIVNITVGADMDGKTQNLGATPFRVKKVPSPLALIAGRVGGRITKSELIGFGRIVANMNADFAYPLKWTVKSYEVSIKRVTGSGRDEFNNPGGNFTNEVRNAINSAQPGSRITFDEVIVTNPILGNRTVNSLSFKLR